MSSARHVRTRCLLTGMLLLVSACSDGPSGPDGGTPTDGDRLTGSTGALAATAIPDATFTARARDYSTDHPDLPGLHVSSNTLMLAPTKTATVGQINQLLEELSAEIVGGIPGVSEESGGVLFLRLPTATHAEMESALARLRASAAITAASQDVLMQGDLLPAAGSTPQEGWTWELVATGGNWGLEVTRMPQAWSLNPGIEKTLGPAFRVPVAIIDEGFAATHQDLVWAQSPAGAAEDHGTLVAGIIGARFDNALGINGVTPYAGLTGHAALPQTDPQTPILERLASCGQLLLDRFDVVARTQPQPRVINISMGFNWVQLQDANGPQVIPSQSAAARELVDQQGALFKAVLEGLQAEFGRLPIVVVSAGNNSAGSSGVQQARYNSPMANAAIRLGARNIIVAEGIMQLEPSPTPVRFPASDQGGHLSAAAFNVRSTIRGDDYAYKDGTSFAAPHIAGLAAHLFALDPDLSWPTLTQNLVLELLTETARPVSGVAPRIDGFAAALQLDVLRQNDRVLRMLLDVDDGTLDGNLRVDLATGDEVTEEDEDGDGGPGDGLIDMADFRRWRDWLLQAEGGAALNGSSDHPKRDLNGDGRVQDAATEGLYPRGDFNGDGMISRTAENAMAGVLGGLTLTDLEVLQAVFADVDYTAADLQGLVESGDLDVDATRCLQGEGVAQAHSSVRVRGSETILDERVHADGATEQIYTLPVQPGGYTLRVWTVDAEGTTLGQVEKDLEPAPGSDELWASECDTQLSWTFDDDFDSWEPGTSGSQGQETWGTVVWLSRDDKGVVKLDGTGSPGQPNSWISRSIALPENATRITFEASAHNRDGADAILRVRLVDAGGASHNLGSWVLTGAEGVYLWSNREVSISSFAGQTVRVFFEQDDNGFQGSLPGGHEQVYLDNIVIAEGPGEA